LTLKPALKLLWLGEKQPIGVPSEPEPCPKSVTLQEPSDAEVNDWTSLGEFPFESGQLPRSPFVDSFRVTDNPGVGRKRASVRKTWILSGPCLVVSRSRGFWTSFNSRNPLNVRKEHVQTLRCPLQLKAGDQRVPTTT
jgi:hypothetical protein